MSFIEKSDLLPKELETEEASKYNASTKC